MEKRLCYCKACASFFIITPDKACPKCQGRLVSSVITEEEWNGSNAEQKTAFKNSLAALSGAEGARQKRQAPRNKSTAKTAKTAKTASTANSAKTASSANTTSTAKTASSANTAKTASSANTAKTASSANTANSAKTAKPVREEKSGEKSRKPAEKSKGNSLLGTLLLLLVIGFGVFMVTRPHDGACEDYESAGKKIYKQISKRDSNVYVSYNSDHYNPILGIDTDIYNIMKEACKNNGNPREGDHLAINASWVKGEYTTVKQRDGTHNLNIKLTMSYETTEEQEKELEDKSKAILAGLNLKGASDYEKVRAIYNYICSNVVYDYDHLNDDNYRLKYTAYAAALNKKAVCSGVADLFYYLATSAGLEARITVNDTHAWNIVRVRGKYYYLDPTWDLEMDESQYRYFLRGSEDFVSILNGPEHAAHRPSMMAKFLLGPKHPLVNVQEEYVISEKAYVR